MDGSIELSVEERKVLLAAYRSGKDARMARRAQIVLLVAEGWSYREIQAITFSSFDLIRDCIRTFQQGGSAAILKEDQAPPAVIPRWPLTVEHLDDLRRSLRAYTKIHVVCDNAAFHQSQAVKQYLDRWRDRIEIHFLPKYAPQTNPVERVWWHFHETLTRNHRCRSLQELLDLSYHWFEQAGGHYFEMRKSFPLAT